MTDSDAADRLLGIVRGTAGPTVVVVAALHGDEPAGLHAAQAVLDALARTTVHGRVVGLVGNRRALHQGHRFLAEDLNRGWTPETMARVARPRPAEAPEDAERRELVEAIARATDGAPATFLDLHTMSGDGAPFVIVPTGERNAEIGRVVPAPRILGLDERTDGALLPWLARHGHRGIAIEGGAHGDPAAREHLAAAVWSVLSSLGVVDTTRIDPALASLQTLRDRTADLPDAVRVHGQHLIAPGDAFAMVPGWASFDPVQAGDVIAHDRRGPIVARDDGTLLLPNYAGRGDHGFFVGRRGDS